MLTQVIRTRRGTRWREADTSGSSPILLLAHSLYSSDTSGVLLLLLQQVNGVVNGECLERVCGGSLYSSKGQFPPSTNMGTCQTAIRRIRSAFLPNFTWRHLHVGSADPLWPPLATAFVWVSVWLAWCQMVGDGAWLVSLVWFEGLHCMYYAGWDRLRLCLHIRRIFFLFQIWVPAIQESPKLVEMIRNKPYNYFWCLKVMKRCRSWRLYFWLKDRQHVWDNSKETTYVATTYVSTCWIFAAAARWYDMNLMYVEQHY